jgi:hypothetical protein
LLAGFNLALVAVAGTAGQIEVFQYAWPVNLLLICLPLTLLMSALESIWLLIPLGIILGNGVLLAYYALTGNWDHWVFLWPLEPLLVAVTVAVTLIQASAPDRGQAFIRRVSHSLPRIVAGLAGVSVLLAFLAYWLRAIR